MGALRRRMSLHPDKFAPKEFERLQENIGIYVSILVGKRVQIFMLQSLIKNIHDHYIRVKNISSFRI